jgi:hypothetical protein
LLSSTSDSLIVPTDRRRKLRESHLEAEVELPSAMFGNVWAVLGMKEVVLRMMRKHIMLNEECMHNDFGGGIPSSRVLEIAAVASHLKLAPVCKKTGQ